MKTISAQRQESCGASSETSPSSATLGETTTLADPAVVEEIKERTATDAAED